MTNDEIKKLAIECGAAIAENTGWFVLSEVGLVAYTKVVEDTLIEKLRPTMHLQDYINNLKERENPLC